MVPGEGVEPSCLAAVDFESTASAIPPPRRELVCFLERVKGIEPSWPAWKAGALPLSYTRNTGVLKTGLNIANHIASVKWKVQKSVAFHPSF